MTPLWHLEGEGGHPSLSESGAAPDFLLGKFEGGAGPSKTLSLYLLRGNTVTWPRGETASTRGRKFEASIRRLGDAFPFASRPEGGEGGRERAGGASPGSLL